MKALKNVLFVACLFLPGTVGVGSTIASNAGCTPQEAKTVVADVLTVSQIACIVASQFTDAKEIAVACSIDAKLIPLLQPLLEQKRQAQKAAACGPQDAGAK